MRKRLVVHYGPTENALHSINEFGLNKDCLPCELGGNILRFDPIKWLSQQMIREGLDNIKCSSSISQGVTNFGFKAIPGPGKHDSTVLSQHDQGVNKTEKRITSDTQLSRALPHVLPSPFGRAPSN
mmetsp:Transcript_31279/g.93716  ORF Transcript_31279/g.93716 Transcript_31279/m.93716 type:complete len:126 (-) Transcript_31279:486-863(-)